MNNTGKHILLHFFLKKKNNLKGCYEFIINVLKFDIEYFERSRKE